MVEANYQFQLCQWLSEPDTERIAKLEADCLAAEPISFKLELGYKLAAAQKPEADHALRLNEFCCYSGADLIGYMGLNCYDGVTGEVNGMVHPAYRRRGICSKLIHLVLAECKQRQLKQVLFLTDKCSEAGIALVKSFGGRPEHEEHEMVQQHIDAVASSPETILILKKADHADVAELLRLDISAFGPESARMLQPELEETRGMTIFLAQREGMTIGKVNLQLIQGIGGIYGLCVHPDYRGRGYGRELLMQSCSWLKTKGAAAIHLQVVTTNDNALHLYQSCGFENTATMAYYEVDL